MLMLCLYVIASSLFSSTLPVHHSVMFCLLYVLLNVFNLSIAQNCRVGTYGNNCQLNCPDQCRPLQTFPCNKKTGRCAEGCNNGYYGDKCDKHCSCPSGICYQANGDCYGTVRTTDQTTQNTSTTATSVQTNDDEGVAGGWRTSAIFLIVLIIFLLCAGVTMVLYVRFKKKRNFTIADTPPMQEYAWGEARGQREILEPLVAMTKENVSLLQTGSDVEVSGGGSEETQSPEKHKGSGEVEELKQDNRKLKVERDLTQAKCEEMKRQLASFEFQEKEIQRLFGLPPNSTNLWMDKNIWLQCPHLEFDKETVNVNVAQINDNMVLLNSQDKNSKNMGKRFQNFQGTTCTEPFASTGFFQYFEAKFDISLQQPFGEGIVAQFGLCGDKEPNTPFIDTKKPCFAVEVASNCDKICLLFIYKGKILHMQKLMNNINGSNQQVHIGIRLRKDMKRIRIFDCIEKISVLGTNIDIGEKIWPMFGVCAQNEASVSVQLVAGRDIKMSSKKKEMIKSTHM